MSEYTQELIDQLIKCSKQIVVPPKREMKSEKGHLRNDMELQSSDGELKFTIFMRRNVDFRENFFIGLEYWPQDERGSICLLRCNGPHGDFISMAELPQSHFVYHIHQAKPENIINGVRAERGGEGTDNFASFEEALNFILKYANITNALEYFPDVYQTQLTLGK
ncbi:MAG: hypothetical protein NTW14_09975 [bacterium]|nr:hypothetical protein [bacterium]